MTICQGYCQEDGEGGEEGATAVWMRRRGKRRRRQGKGGRGLGVERRGRDRGGGRDENGHGSEGGTQATALIRGPAPAAGDGATPPAHNA